MLEESMKTFEEESKDLQSQDEQVRSPVDLFVLSYALYLAYTASSFSPHSIPWGLMCHNY